jgi:hypothetical protein
MTCRRFWAFDHTSGEVLPAAFARCSGMRVDPAWVTTRLPRRFIKPDDLVRYESPRSGSDFAMLPA